MEKKPLTNVDLIKLAAALKIPYFRSVYMLDTLPKNPLKNEAAIVNLDSSSGRGTHWVAYAKRAGVVQYFDSFGDLRPPPALVRYFGPDTVINYNYAREQSDSSVVCGHLCLLFLKNVLS